MTKGFVAFASMFLLAVPVCFAQIPASIPGGLSSTDSVALSTTVYEESAIPEAIPDNPGPAFWVGADYLLWYVKKSPIPIPLVTSGSSADAVPGAVGQAGTTVLFGDTGVNYNQFSGYRINAGLNLTDLIGVEASYFALEKRSQTFGFSDPTGSTLLSESIYGAATGLGQTPAEAAEAISFPGFATGQVAVTTALRLQGWDANLSLNLIRCDALSISLLGGFKTLNLNESLDINASTNILPGITFGNFSGVGPFASYTGPATVGYADSFHTYNNFYGGQLGTRVDLTFGAFTIDAYAKVGLGTTQQVTQIDGSSSLSVPGTAAITVPGGIYAVSSNSGRQYHESFSVVPEAGLNVGYKITDWVSARIGYTYLYWSDVQRPGPAIDRVVNQSLIPSDFNFATPGGANRPVFTPQTSNFWAQGINVGLQFSF